MAGSFVLRRTLCDVAATAAFAAELAGALKPGDLLCLRGELGAGKSELARGVLRALGVSGDIPSPSFNIALTYESAAGPLWHYDFYRLSSPDELSEIGLEDVLGQAIAIIEWPERAGAVLPDERIDIHLEQGSSANERVATLSAREDPFKR